MQRWKGDDPSCLCDKSTNTAATTAQSCKKHCKLLELSNLAFKIQPSESVIPPALALWTGDMNHDPVVQEPTQSTLMTLLALCVFTDTVPHLERAVDWACIFRQDETRIKSFKLYYPVSTIKSIFLKCLFLFSWIHVPEALVSFLPMGLSVPCKYITAMNCYSTLKPCLLESILLIT